MECSLHRALQGTLAVLTRVRPKDLDAPTPCASWDVRALVNHFVGTARWWAATIAGDGGVADADYAAGDIVAAYEESIRIAVASFGADGALDRTTRPPFGEFPATVLLSFATVEQFTHGWDLARAIGQPTDLDPGWPPDCSARRGWRSLTPTAVLTARPCSGLPARLLPRLDQPTNSLPSSAA